MTDEPDFAGLVRVANLGGFWIRKARTEQDRAEAGGRFWVCREGGSFPLYASDDTENVRAWLHVQD